MDTSQHYQLYRRSSIGMALTDSLDELVTEGHVTPQLAIRALEQFDKSITEALATRVRSRATFRGHLETYRFCDEVWTFILQNPSFRMENETVSAEKVKIVACNAKKEGN